MIKALIGIASTVLFIELMDTTILYACAIPVANDFGVDPSKISISIFAYLIGTCIFIPLVSDIAKRFNCIKIITFSLFIFSLLSIGCGISSNFYIFSILRFFQGITISIGSAMTILTLLSHCKSNEIVKVMASINIPALLGTALGPFIGSIFSYYISWRMAFIINFPICIALIIIINPLKNEFQLIKKLQSLNFDILGLFLLSAFLVLLAVGLEKLSYSLNLFNLATVIIGILLGLMYMMVWKLRQAKMQKKNSLLDLNAFKNQDFLIGIIINFISRSAMCGIPLLLSNVLQQYYGYSIFDAGICLSIIAIAAISAKFLSSFIVKLGVHHSIILYVIGTSFSMILLSFLDFWTISGYLWLVCFIFGFMMSFLYTSMNSLLYISLNKNEIPNASNIGTIIQQFSIGLGVVLAIGGFNFVSSMNNDYFEISSIFKTICTFLACIMLFNLIVLIGFYIYKKRIFFRMQKRYI